MRFTSPAGWVQGPLDPRPGDEALREITRRYLRAFEPATREDLGRWWGVEPAQSGRVLAALGDEIVPVDVEGTSGLDAPEARARSGRTEPVRVASLLPAFDMWVIGAARGSAALLDPAFKKRVYRYQGWISPVLLVNSWSAYRLAQARRPTVRFVRMVPLPSPARVRRAAVLACALFLLPAAKAGAALPDLVADRPDALLPAEVYDDGAGPRLLIRFNGYVHNRGPGPFEIQGSANNGGWMGQVRQRVYQEGAAPQDLLHSPAPRLFFETNDDHYHWHLMNIARYSLWNASGTAEVAPAQKVGFCLMDIQHPDATGPSEPGYPGTGFCGRNQPGADSVMMGVSAGWRDVYGRSLAFQWVDVSDVAPGVYRLRSEIDPEATIFETNEVNPPTFAAVESVVPGYRAVNVSQGIATGPRQVQLQATNVGNIPRAPQFKIVTPPAHGSLDRPTGQWFDGGSVRYTPARGSGGPDSFTFAARDPASGFPHNPPAAVATLQSPGATIVTIAGAPARLRTGRTVRLRAVVQNGSPEVSWSVNGVRGGNRTVGRISSRGLYRAPAAVPPTRRVRISARSASGGSGNAVIRIVKAPASRPAPGVPGGVLGKHARRNLLSPLRFARHGRQLLVRLRSAKAGLVVVRARQDGRRIGQCRARVEGGQHMTCAIKLPRVVSAAAFVCRLPRTTGLKLPRMRVSATLYVKGKKRAVRRARVGR